MLNFAKNEEGSESEFHNRNAGAKFEEYRTRQLDFSRDLECPAVSDISIARPVLAMLDRLCSAACGSGESCRSAAKGFFCGCVLQRDSLAHVHLRVDRSCHEYLRRDSTTAIHRNSLFICALPRVVPRRFWAGL